MKLYRSILILSFVFLASLSAWGQHVERGTSIINCRTVPYYARRGRSVTFNPTHTEKEPSNLLPHKFEVAKTNSSNSKKLYWNSAKEGCPKNGGWRLPTQREMGIIILLKKELEATAGFVSLDDPKDGSSNRYYWTLTLDSSGTTQVWCTDGKSNGINSLQPQTSANYARCVREIDDPTIK